MPVAEAARWVAAALAEEDSAGEVAALEEAEVALVAVVEVLAGKAKLLQLSDFQVICRICSRNNRFRKWFSHGR